MTIAATVLFLGALVVIILCAARVVLDWWDERNRRLNNMIREGLARIDRERSEQ